MGAHGGGLAHAAGEIGHLAGGLGDPLDAPALVAVFAQQPQDVAVGAALPGVDASLFAGGQQLFHLRGVEIIPHFLVERAALAGESAHRIAFRDEPRDHPPAERNLRQRRLPCGGGDRRGEHGAAGHIHGLIIGAKFAGGNPLFFVERLARASV